MSVQRQSRRQSVKAKPPSIVSLKRIVKGLDIADNALYAWLSEEKIPGYLANSDLLGARRVVSEIRSQVGGFLRAMKGGPE